MKLFKFVASSGLLSRRKSQESIKSALVTVNNIVEMDPFVYINPEKDIVRLDGQKIKFRRESETIILHKPKGFICSRSDELHRKTIFDLIPKIHRYTTKNVILFLKYKIDPYLNTF